jgi:uncharacterized protein (DUF952 family)
MIFHIVKRSEWEDAIRAGEHKPASVSAEGFIHCSTRAQLLETANRFYRGERELVVLCIEEDRVANPLKFEAPSMPNRDEHDREKSDGMFPHIHGALNLDAVVQVVDFPCSVDSGGRFEMPEELRGK